MYIKSQSGSYIGMRMRKTVSVSAKHVILSQHNLVRYLYIYMICQYKPVSDVSADWSTPTQHGLFCYAQFHKRERERNWSTSPPHSEYKQKPESQTTFRLTIFAGRVKTLRVCEVPRGDLLEARKRYYLQLSRRVANIYI